MIPTNETPLDEATRQISALLGEGLGSKLAGLFALMDIAEDEISAAMVRHRVQTRLLWNCFQFLAPGILKHYDSRLYRSHCIEILERVAATGSFLFQKRHEIPQAINRPTAAECLTGVSQASFAAPMHGEGSLVFHLLFARVYGPASPWPIVITHDEANRLQCEVRHADVTVRLYEDYEDQAADLIDDVRRFLFNKGITSDRAEAKPRELRDIPDHYAPPAPQLRLFTTAA